MTNCDGTLGGFDSRLFNVPKKNIEKAIDTLHQKNTELWIPEKWEEYNTWKQRGYDFLYSRIFYFKSEPEEMYYVTFVSDGNENQERNGPTILAIRSVFTKKHNNWLLIDDFEITEKERIEKRFEVEIVLKLEKYSKTKALRIN